MKNISYIRKTDTKGGARYELREAMSALGTYEKEKHFLQIIRSGDVSNLELLIDYMENNNLSVGNLSKSDLQLAKYSAVITVSSIVRLLIEDGVSEVEAYSMSDEMILSIDQKRTVEEVNTFFVQTIRALAKTFTQLHEGNHYSLAIRKCLAFISQNLHYSISLDQLVQECGLSRTYLSRKFKQESGVSIPEYIEALRMEEAEYLLLHSDNSIGNIAHNVGVSSESYFIKRFKKWYGISPNKYRNK